MSQIQQLGNDDDEEIVDSGSSGNRILEVKNLSVTFTKTSGILARKKSRIKAVDNVSFGVSQSEVVSLVGESGSGKTTIARCILGLTLPTSGSIKFNGVEVTKLRGKALLDYRRSVQFVFQDPFESLIPRMDVKSIVSTPLVRLNGETDKSKVVQDTSRLLNEVGLDEGEVLRKYPHQLSGGQRQRVSIARALASNPKLLIADEPLTMLDASQRLNILALLLQLKVKRNLTILLITHDLASAKMMSERTMVMYLGRVVETGPTENVLSKPLHPYSEMILSATPQLRQGQKVYAQYVEASKESWLVSKGCVFAPRCKYATNICLEQEPVLIERNKSQFAACHNPLNVTK